MLVTLHRPSNVNDAGQLHAIMGVLGKIATEVSVLFPVHPRTHARLADCNLPDAAQGLYLAEPFGYLDFLALQRYATAVITDSGGVQEETTFLGVPCLTLRSRTERPVTVTLGTNTLIGHDLPLLEAEVGRILAGQAKRGRVPPLWDGRAGERIAAIVRP